MKHIALSLFALGTIVILSGCSLPGTSSSGTGAAVMRSDDGGVTFAPKITIDEKTNIASVEVLSMLFDPKNSDHVMLGTRESGIFVSDNAGDAWRKLEYPPTKVYGLARDASLPDRIYASGEWQGRGKVYRSDDNGSKWQEIYSEPSNGTVITALVASTASSGAAYVGTSAGVIVKTTDAGLTWSNAASLGGPVLSLAFDSNSSTLYALVSGKGIFRTTDGGATFDDVTSSKTVKMKKEASHDRNSVVQNRSLAQPTSLATDPSRAGVLYVGTEREGMFVSRDSGEHWDIVSALASSTNFPIRAIVVRPGSSDEIMYSSALAVYRSLDGGAHWSVYQLDANRPVGIIRFDPGNASRVYLGLRTF